MEAKEHAFSFVEGHNFYDIPFFQRNYVWDESNWKDLLESICESKTGFLGSIILKQENVASGETARFMVIDGQQRLTTLSILLRACYDIINRSKELFNYTDEDLFGYKYRFEEMCYVKNNTTRTKEIKIHHSHLDRESYEQVINGQVASSNKMDRITNAYRYFLKILSNYEQKKLERLWNVLTDRTTKLIVKIDLKPDENEQAIFDAINTTGVRLTCADTIKNAIFKRLIELIRITNMNIDAEQKACELYMSDWYSVFSSTQDDLLFWGQEIASGRIKRDKLEILLHCVSVIKCFFDPESQKFADLAQCYKNYIEMLDFNGLVGFIKEIHQYAKLFKENMQIERNTVFEYDDYYMRLLCICDGLEISTFSPYILDLLKQYEDNKDEDSFKEKCFELERYLILHAICNATTKNYNKECVQFIQGESSPKRMLECDSDITSERFCKNLNCVKPNLGRLLLFWCELYKRKCSNVDRKDLKYNFELEHIMPQSWKQCWSLDSLPVFDKDGKVIDDLKYAELIRNESIIVMDSINESVSMRHIKPHLYEKV